ncbi:SurA N-terminal domain-containing protein [Natronospira bacteriovora]|uniref:Periplasmic chaperone PpiD n=1 Tax=Natronospira bacteriovora TaxID=3069753 RepID=A0ABU0W4J9_9GAMM|nr:SurA N-terminal domain-containing protein [Natronospira sp. AB-CW4]MDQ2068949.1 SurA N-terminal domain-containing protein [Natronospira sp. AB-CW4]
MLQSIRDNITGWIAWVVVILLSIPFALFGINTYFEGRFSNDVARVNGEELTNQAFRERYQNQYQQIRQMFGDQFDPEMIDEERLRRQVLDQMIEEELLVQRADDQRYRVSEEEIIAQIQSFEAFQVNGRFDMDRYRGLLRAQGMTPAMLERRIERDMKSRLIQNAITGSAFATELEVQRMAALEGQQRSFSEIRFALDDFLARVEVSEEEVEAYYQANSNQFMTEEAVDLEYVQLALSSIAETIDVSEEELRDAWEANRAAFMEDEERYARHILIAVDNGEDEARARIEALADRLAEGESFETLARDYSDDPLSGAEGGSLGWVLPGDMVDEVDRAIFELEAGEVSEIVRSEFGFHLIRVDEIESPEPMPFEDARDELLAELRQEKAERDYYDQREKLADESFANPDDLSHIASIMDLEIREQSSVTRDGGDGIADHARVRREAFSDMVLRERMNSDPIELDDERVVVIRVTDHHPAEQRPLEEVAGEIRDRLTREKAQAEAELRAEELLAQLRDGRDPAELAEEANLRLDGPRSVGRGDRELDSRVSQHLFRLPRPTDGDVFDLVQRDDGDLALLMLHTVETPELAELSEREIEQRQANLRQQMARNDFNAYLRELRRTADVEVLVDTADEDEVFGR